MKALKDPKDPVFTAEERKSWTEARDRAKQLAEMRAALPAHGVFGVRRDSAQVPRWPIPTSWPAVNWPIRARKWSPDFCGP